MTAARKKLERPNVSAIAEEELAAANNDVDAAVAAMVARIEDDDVLFRTLMHRALYDLCGNTVFGLRRHIIREESPAARQRRTRARAGVGRRHVLYALRDIQLLGGKRTRRKR